MLSYLLESAVCLSCFYACYGLFLRRETFFHWNRAYLLVAPLLSLILPALNFSSKVPPPTVQEAPVIPWTSAIQGAQAVPTALLAPFEQAVAPIGSLSAADLLLGLYGVGALLLLGRLLWRLWGMQALLRRCQKISTALPGGERTKLAILEDGDLPFASFFGYIFWNNRAQPNENQQMILLHELAHVRQRHSADILLLELLLIAQWFNPLMYAFRSSLRAVHEYLADEYVVRRTRQRYAYASLLVQQQTGSGASPGLLNTFHSLTKHRLLMLAKHPSQPLRRAKYLLALPLLALLFLLFSFRFVETLPAAAPLHEAAVAADAWALNLKEVTVLGKPSTPTAPAIPTNRPIFYWCGAQCTLDPDPASGVLYGTLYLDPLTFGGSIMVPPNLWDGTALVPTFSFELKKTVLKVDKNQADAYPQNLSKLESWAKLVKSGEKCALSHLTLPNRASAVIELVFVAPKESGLLSKPATANQSAEAQLQQTRAIRSAFEWAKATAFEDVISVEKFWEVIAQAPVFNPNAPAIVGLQSFEITTLPLGEDPFTFFFKLPFTQQESTEHWARLQTPQFKTAIRPGSRVFVEITLQPTPDVAAQTYGVDWTLAEAAYFQQLPNSGEQEVALRWGPVRFDLGKDFDRFNQNRVAWSGKATEFSMVIDRATALQMIDAQPELLIAEQPQAFALKLGLQCDQTKASVSRNPPSKEALASLRERIQAGHQLLATGQKSPNCDLTGTSFRFYISEVQTPAAVPLAEKPQEAALPTALGMMIAPNPAHAYVQITLSLPQSCQGVLTVYNAAGQAVQRDERRWEAGTFTYTLQKERYLSAAGTYTAVLETPLGRVSKGFVVE